METIQQVLPIAVQSKELQPQGQMPLASGDEQTFKSVISAQPIRNSPLVELENVLKLVMLKIGIRAENLPSPEEKFILIDHILTSYGNHTVAEIRLAFDMAIASKLGLPAKEVVCYENFSCLYFSKIMNAYRVWATETYRYIHSKPPVALIEDKKELTDEEWEEWLADMKKYDVIVIGAGHGTQLNIAHDATHKNFLAPLFYKNSEYGYFELCRCHAHIAG